MTQSKLRRQIAWEAARLMYQRQESEYHRAKIKASRSICRGWVKPADLPSNAEIRDEIQLFARLHEGETRVQNLLGMRLAGLRMMKLLGRFKPRLIGSVLTGHIRQGSDIDLHAFSDSIDAIAIELDSEHIDYDIERKRVRKDGEEHIYTHIHVRDEWPIEITVYARDKSGFRFKSSITGKPIERANIGELTELLEREYPSLNVEEALSDLESQVDRFQVFESLLLPLENVKQDPRYHPEGDALYHSLQVFDLACDVSPYDEEFLTAALLHDVGKAIDRHDHVAAGLEALQGYITERTAWFIEHHMLAHKLLEGDLGMRAKKRLRQSEDYDNLIELCRCDQGGRRQGVETTELEDALDYLRNIDTMFG